MTSSAEDATAAAASVAAAQQIADLQQQLEAAKQQLQTIQRENARSNNDAQQQSVANNTLHVDSYRVPKLPQFFRKDPRLWFVQVEATFRTSRITAQSTMADYVIPCIDSEAISAVADIIADSNSLNKYDAIKERLISTFAISDEAKIRQLLRGQVSHDGKPSQLLIRIKALGGTTCSEAVMRSIFIDHLPEHTRGILAASSVADLGELAKIADAVVDAFNANSTSISSIDGRRDKSPSRDSRIDELSEKLDRLLKLQIGDGGRSRSRSRSKQPGKPQKVRSASPDASRLCYVHKKYGNKAYRCRDPKNCTWGGATLNQGN